MSLARETIGEYLAEHEPVLALWHHLAGIVEDGESEARSIGRLTLPAANVYLVGVFEGEVVKGGFRKFLTDPSGDLAHETLQALRELGAHVSVELLEKAMAVIPEGVETRSRDERRMWLNQADLDDPTFFLAFDELYNQHVDAQSPHRVENLGASLLDYMKEHAAVRLTY